MSHTWRLSDVALLDLWERRFRDCLPAPLFALARGDDAAQWLRLRAEARAEVGTDGALLAALDRVASADVVVSALAVDPRSGADPVTPVRLLAGRQGGTATIIRQLPGESVWHSAGFEIVTGDARRLAGAVVAALPDIAPGRERDIALVTAPTEAETDHHFGRSRVRADAADAERRSRDWLRRPAQALGEIETRLGSSLFGPRGIVRHRVGWRDVVGDGRYAVTGSSPPVASAADRTRLAALVAVDIATVDQTLEDERRA